MTTPYRRHDKCPRCRGPLTTSEHGSLTVHTCADADGWFIETTDMTRLPALRALDTDAAASAAVDDSAPLRCPNCEQQMSRTFVVPAAIYIDICPAHGIWLDRGELRRLADAAAQEQARRPS